MNLDKLKNKLNTELDNIVPNLDQKVLSTPINTDSQATAPQQKAQRPKLIFTVASTFAAIVFVAVCLMVKFIPTTPAYYSPYETIAELSINPSFEIIADSNNIVSSVVATNRDGEILLSKTETTLYIGTDLNIAIANLVDKAMQLGYIDMDSTESTINISALSKDDKKTASLLDSLQATTVDFLLQKGVLAKVETAKSDYTQLKKKASEIAGSLMTNSSINELLKVISERKTASQEQLLKTLANDNSTKTIQRLYKAELAREYIDLIQDRKDIVLALNAINDEFKIRFGGIIYKEDGFDYLARKNNNEQLSQEILSLLAQFEKTLYEAKQLLSLDEDINKLKLIELVFIYNNIDTDLMYNLLEFTNNTIEFIDKTLNDIIDLLEFFDEELTNYISSKLDEVTSVDDYLTMLDKKAKERFENRTEKYLESYNAVRTALTLDDYNNYFKH